MADYIQKGRINRLVAGTNVTLSPASGEDGEITINASGGSASWGGITGTLSNQTDVQSAIDAKANTSHSHAQADVTNLTTDLGNKVTKNTDIVGATKTKITYDTKGLITSGADATTADFADSLNKRFVTDAQLTVIGNTSGTNTGDQSLTNYFLKTADDTDDITVGTTNKFATATEKTKLGNITITQAVDLDTIESDTATNNAKVTNATHTGDATGATALVVVKIQGKDFPALGAGDDQKYPKYNSATNAFVMTAIAGGGDVTGDDTSTTAQNIVAYTGTGGKNITELTGTQGDILYHNGTSWAKLGYGTSGHFLKTQGVGANPVWAAASGGGITTLKKTADQTINAGAATFTDITDLTFAVTSGVDYAFHFYITFRSAQTTTGWKSGVNHPGGTLDFWAKSAIIANGAAGVATHTERHNTAVNDMTLLTATVTAAVDLSIIIEGRYKCTSNGTFAARFANELASNTDLVVQKGSWGYYF